MTLHIAAIVLCLSMIALCAAGLVWERPRRNRHRRHVLRAPSSACERGYREFAGR